MGSITGQLGNGLSTYGHVFGRVRVDEEDFDGHVVQWSTEGDGDCQPTSIVYIADDLPKSIVERGICQWHFMRKECYLGSTVVPRLPRRFVSQDVSFVLIGIVPVQHGYSG